jgi:hypothetical protein
MDFFVAKEALGHKGNDFGGIDISGTEHDVEKVESAETAHFQIDVRWAEWRTLIS